MTAFEIPAFDPDFASNAEWAAMYRACGLQVVPARFPMRTKDDKRPDLSTWTEFHNPPLVAEAAFARWFPPTCHPNMGLVTGQASRNAVVIDLDQHSNPEAAFWWRAVLEIYANGIEPETWKQTTGGGGRQIVFEAPPGWHAPTNKTSRGVDIRGQGGFAMLPPSRHLSGGTYAWDEGCAPWDVELCTAPDWLLQAIDDLVAEHGGDKKGEPKAERVPHQGNDFDAFGARVDGREDALSQWAWRTVVELYRETRGVVPADGGLAHFQASSEHWLRHAKTRLRGVDNATGLERECRGAAALIAKCERAMRKWDGLVAQHAGEARESTRPFGADRHDERAGAADEFAAESTGGPSARFVFETVDDLRRLPPTRWLVKGWIPAGSSGLFYGKWAAGKSFVGFDLGLHLSYAMTDWHGADLPEGGADVLVLAREGHAGFVGRVDAFKRAYGVAEDPGRLRFMRAAVSFMRDDDFRALCDAVRATGIRFSLIIVDTVARVLPGVDMNEQQTVTLFTERCAILGEITGAAVIGVHHENKNGGMMGSTYFEANADFVFEISRLGEEDEPLREGEIVCTKMKDGEDRWRRAVTYSKIGLSDIDPEPTSLVVSAIKAAGEPVQAKSKWPEKDICRQVLAAVDEAWRKGGSAVWSDSPNTGARYAARIMKVKWRIEAGLARTMVDTWLINGVLSVEERDAKLHIRGLKVTGSID